MLVFYLTGRYENFRAKKTIKSLTHTLDESAEMITNLKKELETLQPGTTAPIEEEANETVEMTSSEVQPDTGTKTDADPAPSV